MTKIQFKKLQGKIYEKGYTMSEIADKLGVSMPTFRSRMHGKKPWTTQEIDDLSALLEIKVSQIHSYFFA